MKFLEIKVGKSINPNTGENWYKSDVLVSLEKDESPDEVFKQVRDRIDGWLPNPFEAISISHVDKESDVELNKQFNEAKAKIIAAKTKEEAGQILIDSGFRLNVELSQIVNSK